MRAHTRRGVTLVELLVVVMILLTLTAIALPALSPSITDRKIREASRGVSTFLSVARARAIRLGRPVGVQLRRLPDPDPNDATKISLACASLVYVDLPEPYAGPDATAMVEVQVKTSTPPNYFEILIRPSGGGSGFFPLELVRDGDFVRLGYQGPLYRISSRSDSQLQAEITDAGGYTPPWPPTGSWSSPVPFQIIRQPSFAESGVSNKIRIRQGSSDTYQLPQGTVIDLSGSAFPGLNLDDDNDGALDANAGGDLTIMFSPTGGIAGIYGGGNAISGTPALGNIHLLIGLADKVGEDLNPDAGDLNYNRENWRDLRAKWITISTITGVAATFENAPLAQAVCRVENGSVVDLELTDPGEGYSGNPQVVFVGGGGSGASATASVSGGRVTAVNGGGGSGYVNQPEVVFRSNNVADDIQMARRYTRGATVHGGR